MTFNYDTSPLDIRRIMKQIFVKLPIIIAATIVGAIIGILSYKIYACLAGGNQVYEIRNDYFIYLNKEISNSGDYFNAYTWDGILRDDPVVNLALEATDGVTKEDIVDSITGEILGDYRLLTVVCRGTDPEMVQRISDAYKTALPRFAEKMDMLEAMEVWTDSDIVEVDEFTRDNNAAILGAIIGFVLSFFGVLIFSLYDDTIYEEYEIRTLCPNVTYLGPQNSEELRLSLKYKSEDAASTKGNSGNYLTLSYDALTFDEGLIEEMKASDGVILKVTLGKTKVSEVSEALYNLKKLGINLVGSTR